MRVALACPYALDAPGGVQVQVRELAERLRAGGHEVLVLGPARQPLRDPGFLAVGRPVRVRFNGSIAPICPDPASRRRVREALAAFAPDLVHAHEPFVPSTGLYATLEARVPVVGTFHAYLERPRALAAFAPLLRIVWRRLRVRTAVSEAAAAAVRARFGEVRIVPNAVDVERFRAATPAGLPPGRRLLFVGRLEPRKGFEVAARAFAELAEEFPDLLLVVAGAGRRPEGLEGMEGMRPETRGRVSMLGLVANDELPRFHAAADVFLAPARGGESFGVVLVEAMAAGLPVVASDIPGYREVVRDGVEGLLVPPDDPAALAAAVRRLLRDPDLAGALAAAGRARAGDFSWDRVLPQVEDVYRQAIGAG